MELRSEGLRPRNAHVKTCFDCPSCNGRHTDALYDLRGSHRANLAVGLRKCFNDRLKPFRWESP